MGGSGQQAGLTLGSPAVYRIAVAGDLDPELCARLAGMVIEADQSRADDRARVTTLVGRLADQAQLIGVVNALYEMRLPILAVEMLRQGPSQPIQIQGEGC